MAYLVWNMIFSPLSSIHCICKHKQHTTIKGTSFVIKKTCKLCISLVTPQLTLKYQLIILNSLVEHCRHQNMEKKFEDIKIKLWLHSLEYFLILYLLLRKSGKELRDDVIFYVIIQFVFSSTFNFMNHRPPTAFCSLVMGG